MNYTTSTLCIEGDVMQFVKKVFVSDEDTIVTIILC